MSGDPHETDVRDSQPDPSGDMGVSSEREGHAGPRQRGPAGIRDVTPAERDPDADVPPEQAPGAEEENPEGLDPKAGYSSLDPRSED